jgi:DNA-binding response OmpR family regulator
MKILLVEDDPQVTQLITTTLAQHSYIVETATDGQSGWELVDGFSYALVILDVGLPKLDGISFCRRLRSQHNTTPVLLLTAQDRNTDKILGLDAGADDYMVKPFDVQELTARIRALLRRGNTAQAPLLVWGDLQLDPSNRELTYGGQKLTMRPKELALLELFLRSPHRLYSRSDILDQLWSFDDFPNDSTVKAHIKGIRHALKPVGAQDIIETLYGQGYRLNPAFLVRPAPPASPVSPAPPPIAPLPASIAPELEQVARSTIAQIWNEVKGLSFERLASLEQTVQVMQTGNCDLSIFQQAEQNAHKLAGSLGSFGFPVGSQIAKALETQFEALAVTATITPSTLQHVESLVSALRRQLTAGQPGINLPSPEIFRLLLIGCDRAWSDCLIAAAGEKLHIDAEATLATALQKVQQHPPDLVLLQWVAGDRTAGLTLLQTLSQNCVPAIPVIVVTEPDIGDRIAIARLGGQAIISPTTAAAAVIQIVGQVLQAIRQPHATVLAVDDDPQVLTLLQALLAPVGIQVISLSTPAEFWQTLTTTIPDLVLLDVEMPEISGLELCQTVRQDPRWNWLPILFLTGHADPETIEQAFAIGADDYVTKPIIPANLIRRVLNRLERTRRLRRPLEV